MKIASLVSTIICLSSCGTIKTQHHIILDHNIKVDISINETDAITFYDKLSDPVLKYERHVARAQETAIQGQVDMFLDYLYSDVQ
jgi:hypothetical protein